jgi:hypothetical protein
MSEANQSRVIALGLAGAVVGGCIGYYAFFWIARQGFYALVLPPGLLGWAAAICARERSSVLAAICGVAGFALALFTEWQFAPFVADRSLSYFVMHLHELTPITMLMVALGTFASYSLALGRNRKPSN